MAEPFKNFFNRTLYEDLCTAILKVHPAFEKKKFLGLIFDDGWEDLELKERMRHTTNCLGACLGDDFGKNVEVILGTITELRKQAEREDSIGHIFFPDFIEVYGLEHPEISFRAMEQITQFISCEFAIRPFILRYPEEAMAQMRAWAGHEVAAVRRLASEGCRPRLPWAMALPDFKKDPSPVLPILEALRNDPSEFVRRSVANNLNDISKDNPELVIDIAIRWIGQSKESDKLVKHACRTLLKAGNSEVLELFGFGSVDMLDVENMEVHTPEISIGDDLRFSFDLKNKAATEAMIRLEYAVYYQKANGSLSKKVYKISEKTYPAQSTTAVERKQSFRQITTRKFHPGKHQVAVIANGKEFGKADFELLA